MRFLSHSWCESWLTSYSEDADWLIADSHPRRDARFPLELRFVAIRESVNGHYGNPGLDFSIGSEYAFGRRVNV